MGLILWIVVGIVLGLIAKWVTRRRIGWFWTLAVGIVGALLGGFLGRALGYGGVVNDFSIWSFLIAIGVSIVLLLALSATRIGRRRKA
jgi:uncharacterized membrane protein YeaQ/YmgE (transglycosylase-associated protein family)